MKTFEDLVFNPHKHLEGLQARMDFENGYGISVVRLKTAMTGNTMIDFTVGMKQRDEGYASYTSNEDEWEVAVIKNGDICYSTDITDHVLGYQSKEDVTEVMKKIQLL